MASILRKLNKCYHVIMYYNVRHFPLYININEQNLLIINK